MKTKLLFLAIILTALMSATSFASDFNDDPNAIKCEYQDLTLNISGLYSNDKFYLLQILSFYNDKTGNDALTLCQNTTKEWTVGYVDGDDNAYSRKSGATAGH